MQEKTMVLDMVKNGIINVDDAVKLLNALNISKSTPKDELDNAMYKMSKNIDNIKKDLKAKFYDLTFPDTVIKENTQKFFNKTGEVFDDFTNSMKNLFNQPIPENQNYNQFFNEFDTMPNDEII